MLGPILFLVYINDLMCNIETYGGTLYADDASIMIRGANAAEIRNHVITVLERMAEWFQANKLKVNESKTQHLLLSHSVPSAEPIKFLGVHLESRLGWKTNIDSLISKLSVAVFTIRRMKMCASTVVARQAYFANFHAVASQSILLWGATSEALRVLRLQKRAVRALYGLAPRDSCRETFITEEILTVPCMYIHACLKYVHKNIHQFPRNSSRHAYNTRNKAALETPFHRLASTQRFVDHWGPVFYNMVPDRIKALNENCFNIEVKRVLLRTAMYEVTELFDCDIFDV